MKNIDLSIIIVSFNTKHITIDCLKSLKRSQLSISHEVIVVDNASSDGSADLIAEEFPDVRLIRNEKNLMFAKANNQAAKIAKGDYLLLLNSDTIVESGNLEKLFHFIESRPETGCVGPCVLNQDGSVQSEGESFDSYRYVLCRFFHLNKLPLPYFLKKLVLPFGFPYGLNGRTRPVGWVAGCCLMVSRSKFESAGGLDESFSFYYEETEFCYRLNRLGFKSWVVPSSKIVHLGGESYRASKVLKNESRPQFRKDLENRYHFYERTCGVSKKISLNRLRILLYSIALTILRIFKFENARLLHDKLMYQKKETDYFLKRFRKSSKTS